MREEHRKIVTALPMIMAIGALMLGIDTGANTKPRDGDSIATLPALVTATPEMSSSEANSL